MDTDLPNKKAYFLKLHRKLGQKFFLGSDLIFYLREAAISKRMTMEEIRDDIKRKINNRQKQINNFNVEEIEHNQQMKLDYNQTMQHLAAFRHLLIFLRSCTPEDWSEITQITPYDRNNSEFSGEKETINY